MNNEELKVVLQGALDGKTIQFLYPDRAWFDIVWKTWQDLLVILNTYGQDYPFRIKPDVKVFKYKTRPCLYRKGDGSIKTDLWTSISVTEDVFKTNRTFFQGVFKWLAPATEHEVEYE